MLGTTVCDGFTRGDSLEVTLGDSDLMPKETAVKIIRTSVELLCPKHAARLKEQRARRQAGVRFGVERQGAKMKTPRLA